MNQWINAYIIIGILAIVLAIGIALYQRSIQYKPDRSLVIMIGCIGIAGFTYLVLSDTNHILK